MQDNNGMNQVKLFFGLSIILSMMLQCGSAHAIQFATKQQQVTTMPTLAPIIEDVAPSVVWIDHIDRKSQSLGTGVIIDVKRGYIITNAHVVNKKHFDGNRFVRVKLSDGRIFKGEVLGVDKATDIAVVKINANGLKAIRIADSDDVVVGQLAIALGNPMGFHATVTSGIVSATHRKLGGFKAYEDFIQTDAAINPGNSGGALVNIKGELIGINSATKTITGQSMGMGFAVSSNMAMAVASQLIEYGDVIRGSIGIETYPATSNSGVRIKRVKKNSSAGHFGLKKGDVITRVNGYRLQKDQDFETQLSKYRVGSLVEIEFDREGVAYVARIKVDAK